MAKLNQTIIRQMTSEGLQDSLGDARDKADRCRCRNCQNLVNMIERELNQRQALGVNRPARIEDWLG